MPEIILGRWKMIDWTVVTGWLLEHGVKMLIIIALLVAVYFVMRKTVSRAVRRTVSRTMEGQPEIEIEKRRNTLETGWFWCGRYCGRLWSPEPGERPDFRFHHHG